MKFEVRHHTTYRYARPVAFQQHRMTLCPRSNHDLIVLASSLNISPPATLTWTQDVFGNVIATGIFNALADHLVIKADMTVEQSAVEWPVFQIAVEAQRFPFSYAAAADAIDLGALRQPENADEKGDVRAWASRFASGETDTLSLLKALNASVLDMVAYRIRDEEGTQTAAETLTKASGSCRDMAALLIDAVRLLGFGARAVSGYLYDPNALASDPGSTHAWAEVFLPGAGWITFDPTRRWVGGANLIPVAVGRNNGQIMPIVGGYLGQASDFVAMDVEVKVTRRL